MPAAKRTVSRVADSVSMSFPCVAAWSVNGHAGRMFSAEPIQIEHLRGRLPVEVPIERPLSSGVRALDGLLGADGLGAGQTVEWVGAASSGKTGLLRAVVAGARRQGVAVALIDGRRELLAADWVDDAPGRLWVIRPPEPAEALFCAEVALRTRCFGLVIVDGAPAAARAVGVRLQRLARHATATLVLVRAPDEDAGGARVHRRFSFGGQVEPVMDPIARRGPLAWRISAARTRGGGAEDGQALHLVEATPDRLAQRPQGPDRPGDRWP